MLHKQLHITRMTVTHAIAVIDIYRGGIAQGNATFETEPPAWDGFDASHLRQHRFVALTDNETPLGWAACALVSDRCVYAGVVEHSVYVHPDARGRGVGRQLLDTLIASIEEAGIWTIQSGIFPEDTASLALHQAAGFRIVGIRQRIGQHHGTWRDVVLIERRSARVSITRAGATSTPRPLRRRDGTDRAVGSLARSK